MKRWDSRAHDRVVDPKVDAFLDDIEEVCRKHGMSLGHEDGQGAFIVYTYINEHVIRWMQSAGIEHEEGQP